jgi:glycyl-tRNA synthetase beta chain
VSARSLLLEIGCEELPSTSLRSLGEGLQRVVTDALASRGLAHGAVRWFATPRRLAVHIEALEEEAPSEEREALGPPLAQARDDTGAWTRAAEGFAARQGIGVEALQVVDTPKGPRVGVVQHVPGARTRDELPALFAEAIAALPVAKRMRWGASHLEFARPIQWLVVLYGDEAGFGPVLGIETGRTSRGHRFHAPEPVELVNADAYEDALAAAYVIADFTQRAACIEGQVRAAAGALGATALIDADLLDEVCSLVEWPVALAGSFDRAFLDVPAEALISSMQTHQKYFPVVDADGALLPHFITVANIESRRPESVIAGNERVIRPRLADAAFFYRQDLEHSLESRRQRLDGVVFEARLGSIGDKSDRIARLARHLAEQTGVDAQQAERAAQLCKADLVSELVLEFGDLQGIAGAYYARHDGEDEAVCRAIEEHYWPLQAGSPLPEDGVAVTLALADRLDTLMGIFGIGQAPSGSRDPFGLRRAAIAVLRLLIEKQLDLDLRDLLAMAAAEFDDGVIAGNAQAAALDYLLDRLPALFEARQLPVELFRAVRATGCTQALDFVRRLDALEEFTARPEAGALAAANKRVGNILAKAEDEVSTEVSADLLHELAEKDLSAAIDAISAANREDLAKAAYGCALARLASLRGAVDRFFDDVMVNSDDADLRRNRLALLARLRREFTAIADISLLAG